MSKVIFFAVIFSLNAKASTFIGNGGNVNDVELKVTLKQIENTIDRLGDFKTAKDGNEICKCAKGYEDHPLCEAISTLNDEQIEYCENFGIDQMQELRVALQSAKFEWSGEDLQVQESSQIRSADAVTVPEKMKIYLKQDGFVSLTPMKRMFLVTHELYHLTKYRKKTVQDDEPIGPFTGDKGGRNLLNAAAAGLTMFSVEKHIFQKQTGYLDISKNIRSHWLSLLSPNLSVESDQQTQFKLNPRGPRFSYRYQFSQQDGLGLSLHIETTNQRETVLGTIQVDEKRSVAGVGVNYRWLPFKKRNVLGYMRNSHFLFELLFENISGEYSLIEEPFISEKYSVSQSGPSLKAHYLFPFKNNFWADVGLSFDNHKLSYARLNLDYNKNSIYHLFAGVSYGF